MFYADHTYMILDHTKIDFYYVNVDVCMSGEGLSVEEFSSCRHVLLNFENDQVVGWMLPCQRNR